MAEQVTLADVARWAGVSLATASRALHGGAGRTVGPGTAGQGPGGRRRTELLPQRQRPGRRARHHQHRRTDRARHRRPVRGALASGVMAAAAERDLIVTIASDPVRSVHRDPARRGAAQAAGEGGDPRRVAVQRRRSPPTGWPRNWSASRWRRARRGDRPTTRCR